MTQPEKKSNLRDYYHETLSRRPGESMVSFGVRFRQHMSEMKLEGIVMDDADVAYQFRKKLGLDELRLNMLDTRSGMSEDRTST